MESYSLFDKEEPSDLSRAICDREEKPESPMWLVIPFLILALLSLGFFLSSLELNTAGAGGDVINAVQEIEGVLYYPDGQPVRNYEQLNLYLESE